MLSKRNAKICAALLFLIFTSTYTIRRASVINSQYLQSVKIGQDKISAVNLTAPNNGNSTLASEEGLSGVTARTSHDSTVTTADKKDHYDSSGSNLLLNETQLNEAMRAAKKDNTANTTHVTHSMSSSDHPSGTTSQHALNPILAVETVSLGHFQHEDTVARASHEGAVNTTKRGNAGANTVRANDQGGFNTPLNGTQWIAPTTVFTPHILSLVELFQKNRKHCLRAAKRQGLRLDVSVHSSSQISVEISKGGFLAVNLKKCIKHKLLDPKRGRLLPRGNVTFRVSFGDKSERTDLCCFANSSPRGENAVFNFQDVGRWAKGAKNPEALPWEERSPVPVFRGTVRGTRHILQGAQDELEENLRGGMTADDAGAIFFNRLAYSKYGHRRLALVHFSKMNPDLVDARISSDSMRPMKEFWRNNATNGMHRALPFHEIPKKEYYTRYQTHIVMGGIGAAFRTARILGQTVAVIMQDYPYEEWYLKLMEPFVHYVPLERDLSNLNETLRWVRDNPAEMHRIAENGRAFHDKYLSFERMSEFYHELVLRLMLCCGSIEGRPSPAGTPEPGTTEGPAGAPIAAAEEPRTGSSTEAQIFPLQDLTHTSLANFSTA